MTEKMETDFVSGLQKQIRSLIDSRANAMKKPAKTPTPSTKAAKPAPARSAAQPAVNTASSTAKGPASARQTAKPKAGTEAASVKSTNKTAPKAVSRPEPKAA